MTHFCKSNKKILLQKQVENGKNLLSNTPLIFKLPSVQHSTNRRGIGEKQLTFHVDSCKEKMRKVDISL